MSDNPNDEVIDIPREDITLNDDEMQPGAWEYPDGTVEGQQPDSRVAPKLKIAIVGDNYLSDATRVAFDQKITDVKHGDEASIDDIIEWQPNIVFICTDIPLLKNDSLDDANFINVVMKIAKQTQAGVCVKTTINNETLERLVPSLGVEWYKHKFVYSPEIYETAEEVLQSDVLMLGGEEKAREALQDVLKTHSYFSMKEVVADSVEVIAYAKLGLAGFKAVKQTFFNQLHHTILDLGGANPTHVRRIIEKHPLFTDSSLAIPTFIRAMIDGEVSMKQAKSYGGEYANNSVKMLSCMTDRLTLLDECINLRNLKD
jgi:hypothetical protein